MTFNLWTFLIEIVNFVVLAYVLHRLLYRPLHEAIDRRRKTIADATAAAAKARDDAEALRRSLEAERDAIQSERDAALHAAREEAEAERKRMATAADEEIRRRREAAEEAVARQTADAREALGHEVAEQAVALAERLLEEAAGATLDRRLALRLAETLRATPDAERDRIRAQWPASATAVLEEASALDDDTRREVSSALSELAGRQVAISYRTKPDLLAGVRLEAAGRVWDASFAAQMEDARASKERSVSHG